MGQPVTVIEKATPAPGVVRYETNRALSGMGHELYRSPEDILWDRPVDEVARRVFAHGGVASVHVNGSVITVQFAPGASSVGVKEIIEGLYTYYQEGDEPEMVDA
jgi:hypothetical protein